MTQAELSANTVLAIASPAALFYLSHQPFPRRTVNAALSQPAYQPETLAPQEPALKTPALVFTLQDNAILLRPWP